MDPAKLWLTVILLLVLALTVGGYFFAMRALNRRGLRLRAEAEARGETVPSRRGKRIAYVLLGVACLIVGFAILRQ